MSDWAGTGRHVTPIELQAWTGFLDAGRLLEIVLSNHLATDHQLTHREYEILVRLDGADGRMRMTTMAHQIAASGALITQTVKKLESRSLVRRERAESGDGREVEAVLLPKGRATLADASSDHAAIIKSLLIDRVGNEHLDGFAFAIHRVAEHLRSHRRGEPCDDPQCPVSHYG